MVKVYRKQEQARIWAFILNGLGWATGAWVAFYPRPFALAAAVAVAVPVVAVLSMRFFPGVMKFEPKKGTRTPAIFHAFLVPLCGLLLAALLGVSVLEWRHFWAPFAVLSATLFALTLVYAEDVRAKLSVSIPVLLFCLLYGAGATLTLNRAFDGSVPTTYQAQVMSKRVSRGKSTTYYLEISPWGPKKEPDDVDVPKSVYNAHATGDTVRVTVKAGGFGIPWFYVR